MSKYPRVIYQPPAGRPRWINTSESGEKNELQYLSWGWRAYGRHPIPVSLHAGWIYQLVLSGRAILNACGKKSSVHGGTLVIIGPGCPNGWNGSKETERCKILTWIWRDPPLLAHIRPAEDGWKAFKVPPESVKRLEMLHAETRGEITFSDEAATPAIHAIRARIDVILGRISGKAVAHTSSSARLQYALSWLGKHPEELRPVAALSDYLQISAITLNRLFRLHLGKSVREVAHAMRMEVAREMLAGESLPVKELSFRLGYSHPNDFSRAYSRFWNQKPSARGKQAEPPVMIAQD